MARWGGALTLNARDDILNKLRQVKREEPQPAAWQSRRQFPDLAARFDHSLTANKGECFQEDSLAAAYERVNFIIRSLEAEKVVLNRETALQNLPLLTDVTYHTVGDEPAALRDFCAAADVGLSAADAALAETGTIVIGSGAGKSRLVTLLPTVHIALVAKASLTTDLFTWSQTFNRQLPSNLNFISAPSKTADIEQTMAIGVHGPKRFIVILYD